MSYEEKTEKFEETVRKRQEEQAKIIREEHAIQTARVEARRNIYLFSPFKSNRITCQIQELSHGMILSLYPNVIYVLLLFTSL